MGSPSENNQLALVDIETTGDIPAENSHLPAEDQLPAEGQKATVDIETAEEFPNENNILLAEDQMAIVNGELTAESHAEMNQLLSESQTMDSPAQDGQLAIVDTETAAEFPNENDPLLAEDQKATVDTETAAESCNENNHLLSEDQMATVNGEITAESPSERNQILSESEAMDSPPQDGQLAMMDTVAIVDDTRKERKKSKVWEHFTLREEGNGCSRAICNQCNCSFAYRNGDKVAGTSHLIRHMNGTRACRPDSAPTEMGATVNGTRSSKRRSRVAGSPFDPAQCSSDISRMIVMHDYPLHIVEDPGFVAFARYLQPQFDMVNLRTIQDIALATYEKEKQSLKSVVQGIAGRVCLSLDLWTSSQSMGYVFINGQFIDHDWKVQRKLLSVVMVPYPESDSAFREAVESCLSDWYLEGRLFSLTLDQQLSEIGYGNLRDTLCIKDKEVLHGQLLLRKCFARSLSSVAQRALMHMHETVKIIRDIVKYVKTSEQLAEEFLQLKHQLQVPSEKKLILDDLSQWNTTYEMLVAASELKEVFSCLDTLDSNFQACPSMEVWRQVDALCKYLKLLMDSATILANPVVSTSDTFFHEAWKIQLELSRAVASDEPFVRRFTKAMQEEFDKYWKECCVVLCIAVVMDPRFKMKFVEFNFRKIYGDTASSYVKLINEGLHELFLHYESPLRPIPTYQEDANAANIKPGSSHGLFLSHADLELSDFDMYVMETTKQKSELEQYLEDSLLPRISDFDVLGWWKLNKMTYPNLSKMACDVLTIPVCTLSPDAVFDTVTREMESHRCCLPPKVLEALICTKDWLESESMDPSYTPLKADFPV